MSIAGMSSAIATVSDPCGIHLVFHNPTMMSDDFEPEIQNQKELLYGFYKTHECPLSEEEEESLNPILNSLKNTDSRDKTPV